MKIRQGFVSNSSSSSFIVGTEIDLNTLTLEEFEELLGYFYLEIYNYDEEKGDYIIETISINEFSERIFNDLKCGISDNDTQLLELFKESFWCEASDYANSQVKQRKKEENWALYNEIYDKKATELAKVDLDNWKREHKFTYVVSYSDDNGEAHLEHQEIFRNFAYKRFSHH